MLSMYVCKDKYIINMINAKIAGKANNWKERKIKWNWHVDGQKSNEFFAKINLVKSIVYGINQKLVMLRLRLLLCKWTKK